jgi:hypothetical protein
MMKVASTATVVFLLFVMGAGPIAMGYVLLKAAEQAHLIATVKP